MAIQKFSLHRSLIGLLFLSVLTVALSVRASAAGPPAPPTINTVIVNPPSSPVPTTVTNTASNPVPTQNVGGGAATAVGQPVSKIVALICTLRSGCIFPNGNPLTIPSGEALVITDVQWNVSGTSGLAAGTYIGIVITASGNVLTALGAPLDPNGIAEGQSHLGTGIVVPANFAIAPAVSGPQPGISAAAFIQGYFVPNQ